MSILAIPIVTGQPFFSQTVNLEGTDYLFDFRWNDREQAWYFSISQPSDVLLCSVKVVTNWQLLRRFTDSRLPPGEIVAVANPFGDTSNPGLNDFGQGLRVQLLYYPSDNFV